MKVIHFCGESGVGKKTLLRNIWDIKIKMSIGALSPSEQSLLDQFEIEGRFHIWGPYEYKNVERPQKDIDGIWKDMKSDLESGKCQTLIHHWQKCTNGIFELIYDFDPRIFQKVYLFWRPPEQHLKEWDSRCEKLKKQYKKNKSSDLERRIGYYCDKDESHLRNKFAKNRYPDLVNEKMEKMCIETDVIELLGEVDEDTNTIINPSFRNIVEPELSQLIKVR